MILYGLSATPDCDLCACPPLKRLIEIRHEWHRGGQAPWEELAGLIDDPRLEGDPRREHLFLTVFEAFMDEVDRADGVTKVVT